MNRTLLLALALPVLALQMFQPSDVVSNPARYNGKMVEWTGRQIRTSRMPRNAPAINGRLFILVDARGNDVPGQLFLVDGVAIETPAAIRLDRTRGDKGIRRVRGIVRGVGETYYSQGKQMPGPKLSDVTLDAP